MQRLIDRQAPCLLRGAGPRVLDAGAGCGRLVPSLRAAGFEASGIDPSGRRAGLERASIEEHADADLDAVVVRHVLEHLDDPASALERVRDWLRPGGVALRGRPGSPVRAGSTSTQRATARTSPPADCERCCVAPAFEPVRTVHTVWEHNLPLAPIALALEVAAACANRCGTVAVVARRS